MILPNKAKTAAKQLFKKIPNLKLYDFITRDSIKTLDSHNIPFIVWPNGSPCLMANLYMVELRNTRGRKGNGPSRFGARGGSFGEYASQISHLIRFSYHLNKDFIDFSDNDFSEFIDKLRKEVKPGSTEKARTERTIGNIGRRCLHFLQFVGTVYQHRNFVGIDGTIAVSMVKSTFQSNGRTLTRTSVHHKSFRPPSSRKRRKPITDANVEKLRSAIDQMPTSDFLNARRQLMISCYEEIGGRRSEINDILVSQIILASDVHPPELTLPTLKKGMVETRAIPISPMLIEQMMKFVRVHRLAVLSKSKEKHDFLFLAERGGQRLSPETLSREFSTIRIKANITEQACGHMFRHAFCTHIAAFLIAETSAISPDSFRQTLLTNQMIASRAIKLSGHANIESFLDYVDAAFEVKSKFSTVINNVYSQQVYTDYERRRKDLVRQLSEGVLTVEQFVTAEGDLTKQLHSFLETAPSRAD
ncbi:tyrosine-type recombinase/integrase [Pseudomonas viridiflava]|uniref:tyrosine-type recombinase/integrase n=1 Tax=Pseudomonas viridiflava TaxID=33069 RepID=UPI000F03B74B|nr:tyrosine-type recombinase/integrase [Pseudomonas viridiflava]